MNLEEGWILEPGRYQERKRKVNNDLDDRSEEGYERFKPKGHMTRDRIIGMQGRGKCIWNYG